LQKVHELTAHNQASFVNLRNIIHARAHTSAHTHAHTHTHTHTQNLSMCFLFVIPHYSVVCARHATNLLRFQQMYPLGNSDLKDVWLQPTAYRLQATLVLQPTRLRQHHILYDSAHVSLCILHVQHVVECKHSSTNFYG